VLVDEVVDDRLEWLLDAVRHPAPEELAGVLETVVSGPDPQGLLTWLRSQIEGFEVERTVPTEDGVARVIVACPNGRRWDLRVTVEDEPPHRVGWVYLDRALLDGMELREATPGDDAAIAEVCRNTAIVLRSSTVTIDPGPSYWAAVRLMEHPTVLVVTHHGRVVAVHCGVFYPIVYGGQPQYMSQILHSRVLKEYAGLGLWSVMNRRLVNASRAHREESARSGSKIFENGCAYFATENDATRRLNGAQSMWSFSPLRVVLSCADLASADRVLPYRRAEPSDAERIASLCNALHEGSELFAPYTAASLRARLERAPDVYSWPNVLVSERAVVGVWNAGRIHTKRTLADDGSVVAETRSVRGIVLDHGCEPGAEAELQALLAVAAAESAAAGMTALSIFTSVGTRTHDWLVPLGAEVEQYELSTPYTPEPDGAAGRGLYVDQVYF
jgi:hypothetical protein